MKTTYDANILTYCQWRDGLTMQQSPFFHGGNLIFFCLSFPARFFSKAFFRNPLSPPAIFCGKKGLPSRTAHKNLYIF